MNMREAVRLVRGSGFAIAAAIGLAAVCDWLLYGRVIGWSAAVLVLCVLAVVVVRAWGMVRRISGVVCAALVVGMAAALAKEPSLLAGLMALVLLGICAMVGRGTWSGRLLVWARRWAVLLVRGPLQGPLDAVLGMRWVWRHPRARGGRALLRVGAWVLPVAVGLVFAALFAAANPVIGAWVRSAWDRLATALEWLPQLFTPGRLAMWAVMGVGAYALQRYRQPSWARGRADVERPPVAGGGIGLGLVMRGLVLFNLVFAVQTGMDVVYLWGRKALPHHLTYAEYAHRGAYPLVATALLAAAIVLACFQRGGAAQRSAWARRLVFVWIGQNVFLMMSTIWRIWLYVDAYSLTRWRIAAIIWVGLVAVGFAWIVAKIVAGRSNAWLCRVNVATALAVLYLCAFCNFSGWIAEFNVRHCREVDGRGAPLDKAYLRELGVAALPAVEWVKGRVAVQDVETELRRQLGHELADWRGWTWQRARVAAQIPPLLPEPEAPERQRLAWRGR
jgi:hypothetical protein